eukprot:Phypoly_transcript_16976.p1 GENE.Phypoly_transcript_16976~~Phypoly_transcript_16976.p1  ORF type:complete len:236 (+),score=25.57 Phypoly_transcript_16976:39-710(+)
MASLPVTEIDYTHKIFNTQDNIHNFCAMLAANLHSITHTPENAHATQKLTQMRIMLDRFLRDTEMQSRLREIVMNPPTAIIKPLTMEIVDCNSFFAKLLGKTAENMVGTTVYTITPTFAMKAIRRDMRNLVQSGVTYCERFVSFRHSNGGWVYGRVIFQIMIGRTNAVATFQEIYDEIPVCLDYIYKVYIGPNNVNVPPPSCVIPHCVCKIPNTPCAAEDLPP